MPRHDRSPCITCPLHPCKEPKTCEARWDYVKRVGPPGLQAVDTDNNYSLLPK